MVDVIIVGAGGFGREVYHWAKDSLAATQYRIKGFLSHHPEDLEGFGLEEKILGDDVTYAVQENDRFLLAIGDIEAKKRIIERMKARQGKFISLIHPTAIVKSSARIGEGVILCPFVLVSDHVVLGDFVMMNFYSSCGHDAKVGKYGIFSPYATVNGFVTMDDEVFLGTHATVTGYRRVGLGAKISANSVAMHDVPARAFVFGVPGKIKTIFFPDNVCEPVTQECQETITSHLRQS
jgi:sugar O-acyltransferase (sialic acid O-acetyltransferase NeuD family)